MAKTRTPARARALGFIKECCTILRYCVEADTLLRSAKVALVVGTVLALINHGQQALTGRFTADWVIPMLVTYLVPFSVATYGQAQGKRQRDRQNTSH